MRRGQIELYDLERDPGELENLAERQPERVTQLLEEMERLRSGERSFEAASGMVDDEVLKALHAMGYME